MREIAVYPYKMGSEAATLLAEALGDVWKVYPHKTFKPSKNHLVVNWGNGELPSWDGNHFLFLNRPEVVMRSINKINTFRALRAAHVQIPAYTLDVETALQWLDEGYKVCARKQIEGKDGEGLVLVEKEADLPPAKLYTKFVPSLAEYRVYVFDGKVIDTLQKKRAEVAKADPNIRCESRGWVFCLCDYIPPACGEQAIAAIKALGLNFGGVDVLWSKEQKAYVLETNTAPGIGGRSVKRFALAIQEYAAKN